MADVMKVASLAAIQQPALLIFVRDHRQTPGGLSKGKAPKGMAAAVACVLLIVQGLPPTCSEIGAEHLEMPCKYSTSSEEWWHWGILISEFCAAVCQCF